MANADTIRAYLDNLVSDGKLPGALLMVHKNGELVFSHSHGFADVENCVALTEDTIARIFSMTKPICSVGIMMLMEKGLLDVSDRLSKHVPEWKDEEVRVFVQRDQQTGEVITVPANSPITIHHLLTHTSGIDYGLWPDTESQVSRYYREQGVELPFPLTAHNDAKCPAPLTLTEFCSRLLRIPLAFQPGTKFRYGSNTDVLGRVIEAVSKQSLPNFLQDNILGPLGMTSTAFTISRSQLHRFAKNYRVLHTAKSAPYFSLSISPPNTGCNDENSVFLDEASPRLCSSGGGGLLSTASDYMRFVEMLTFDGEFNGVRIVSPESLARMRQNQITPEQMEGCAMLLPCLGFGYGLSCGIHALKAEHTGGWGGAAATNSFSDRKNKISVVFITQLLEGIFSLPTLRFDISKMVYEAFGPEVATLSAERPTSETY
jgi:CubicO group peptidase (beta-lactamase class C family)